MKIFYVTKKFIFLLKYTNTFADEQEIILFRRYCFSHDHNFLFVGGVLKKLLHIYHFPFTDTCLLGRIGPFDAHVNVVYEYGMRNERLFVNEKDVLNAKDTKAVFNKKEVDNLGIINGSVNNEDLNQCIVKNQQNNNENENLNVETET